MDHTELFKKISYEGFKKRYGDRPPKRNLLRYIWEVKNIIAYGFVDYYLMAYMIFREYAKAAKIEVWPWGAVSSSIVCYCLELTEIDPLHYGLNSARFVNDLSPRFRFLVAQSRFDEFKQGMENILMDNRESFDVNAIGKSMLGQEVKFYYGAKQLGNILPQKHLNIKCKRALPENLDYEIISLLCSLVSLDMCVKFIRRGIGEVSFETGFAELDEILAPTNGLLFFQEQMLDILKLFDIRDIEANRIRMDIQREKPESPTIQAIKKRLFSNSKTNAELAWNVLTSNREAFLKADVLSRVLLEYFYI